MIFLLYKLLSRAPPNLRCMYSTRASAPGELKLFCHYFHSSATMRTGWRLTDTISLWSREVCSSSKSAFRDTIIEWVIVVENGSNKSGAARVV
ncbi:hypothetical protein TorRG33x02_119280 [Trema orientale]|uniref:Uncharacterized protein n=1 Tax=Trema orientale TaxID=63057 RepID=A0A2P5F3I4_TREOI|nr:hypothetical protein TorRG33x02_119280 [Trema orientale]